MSNAEYLKRIEQHRATVKAKQARAAATHLKEIEKEKKEQLQNKVYFYSGKKVRKELREQQLNGRLDDWM